MTAAEKEQIIQKFKIWFNESIIQNHTKNTKKLVKVKEFQINPFLLYYLANYLEGNSDPKSLAKALIYPRILGTSITTTFGTSLQQFITKVLDGYGSTTSGIDIEYIDQVDKRKKYCQLKSGPNALNKDDVTTIVNHFKAVKNLARTNNISLEFNDLVFGLSYGEPSEKNAFIKKLEEKDVTVLIGKEFWTRFTGDKEFFFDLIKAAGEVAREVDMKEIVDNVISDLSKNIDDRFKDLYEK